MHEGLVLFLLKILSDAFMMSMSSVACPYACASNSTVPNGQQGCIGVQVITWLVKCSEELLRQTQRKRQRISASSARKVCSHLTF